MNEFVKKLIDEGRRQLTEDMDCVRAPLSDLLKRLSPVVGVARMLRADDGRTPESRRSCIRGLVLWAPEIAGRCLWFSRGIYSRDWNSTPV